MPLGIHSVALLSKLADLETEAQTGEGMQPKSPIQQVREPHRYTPGSYDNHSVSDPAGRPGGLSEEAAQVPTHGKHLGKR